VISLEAEMRVNLSFSFLPHGTFGEDPVFFLPFRRPSRGERVISLPVGFFLSSPTTYFSAPYSLLPPSGEGMTPPSLRRKTLPTRI